ncbi:MAG: tRNA (N6-isopentenyl adenosine(37)-C2)-methylthiotransferase MiaB, partial [Lachnospiraceae bacterium]|nr:tRNA (N6-isopentenyl adenosine(37)-C2)-methylthiotransferase MiaB [Lachnospiraceae bacterium]
MEDSMEKALDNYKNNLPPEEEAWRQYSFIEKVRGIVATMTQDMGHAPTYCVTTFGCQMNANDSEKLAGILEECGYIEGRDEESDFVIYNTCTVRENANQKVYGRLGVLNGYKRKNPAMKIALCGCMMQEEKAAGIIKKSYPFVDLVFGTHNLYRFPELLYEMLSTGQQVISIAEKSDIIVESLPVKHKYGFKSGVNIMFGCNNFCSYCIVPYVRGRERSRRPDEIIAEIKHLAENGTKEVMLLGQNVNSYGRGLEEEIDFAGLLYRVNEINGIERIRFMTSHPKDLSDELIAAMADCHKVCDHLHLPLQSGSDAILKRMNRHYDSAHYLELVDKLRAKLPDIALTTDIIVGFPGETDEDFAATMDVVKKVGYDSAFTFEYSKRTGTPAEKYEDQIPPEVVKLRFDELLAEVRDSGAKRAKRFEGQIRPVLVESLNRQDEGYVTGRLTNNTVVHLKGDASLIGSIVNVRLKECKGFYY